MSLDPSPVAPWSLTGRLSIEATAQDAQIAASQQIFPRASVLIYNAVNIPSGGISFSYQYGTHEAAIMQQQIVSASVVFTLSAYLPPVPYLGLARAFAITQEEQPLDVPSSFKIRSTYLPSISAQTPLGKPWRQTWPEYPLDQLGTIMFKPAPAAAIIPPPSPTTTSFLVSPPQEFAQLEWNGSDVSQPVGQVAPVPVSLFDPVSLTLTETLSATGQWEGVITLSWSASPGVLEYRLYINGVPQANTMHALVAQVSGLALDTQYSFAIVASPLGTDSSPLSNVIEYRHASSAEFESSFTYPYGDTFETGKVIVVPLFTPE